MSEWSEEEGTESPEKEAGRRVMLFRLKVLPVAGKTIEKRSYCCLSCSLENISPLSLNRRWWVKPRAGLR